MSTYAMSLSKAIALVGMMVFTSATVRAQTSVVTVAPGQKTQLAEGKQTINVKQVEARLSVLSQ
jgi:hypothetical protein